jgi:hypothetical protein
MELEITATQAAISSWKEFPFGIEASLHVFITCVICGRRNTQFDILSYPGPVSTELLTPLHAGSSNTELDTFV